MNVHTKELFEIFSHWYCCCSYNFIICYVTSCARCAELRLSTKLFSVVKLWICRLSSGGDCESDKVNGWRAEQWGNCLLRVTTWQGLVISRWLSQSLLAACAWHRFLNNSKHNPLWSELFKAITSYNDDYCFADNQHEAIFRPIIGPVSRSLWCALRLFEFSLDKIVMIYRTRRLKARKAKSFVSLLWFSLSGAFRRQPRAEENRRGVSVRRLTTALEKKKTRWNLAESWFKQALDSSESGASGWER